MYFVPSVLFFFFLMIRRPPRSTLDRSSAASDVYKRQAQGAGDGHHGQHRRQADRRDTQVDHGLHEHLARAAQRRTEPVSYTHLRAHETVLDLVCRLLLEKKTPHPKSHVADTATSDIRGHNADHNVTR